MPRKVEPQEAVAEVVEVVEEAVEKVETPFEKFVDHQKKAFVEAGKAFSSLLPEGLREHGQTAVREMVEGYRTLFNSTLDDLIKTLEKARVEAEKTLEKAGAEAEKTVEKVKLDENPVDKVVNALDPNKK